MLDRQSNRSANPMQGSKRSYFSVPGLPAQLLRTTAPGPKLPVLRPGYPKAMTLCIAAHCKFESQDAIVLCSDRRIDYGVGLGAHEKGWKFSFAGPGWSALMSGTPSRCEALLSLYRKHLQNLTLDETNAWQEMQVPLTEYKQVLKSKSFPSGRPVELLINGFLQGSACTFRVCATEEPEDEAFAVDGFGCAGSGATLAHYSMLFRGFSNTMGLHEALYYVFEAKKWSEMETGVNKETILCVQVPAPKPNDIVFRFLETDALRVLKKLHKRLGPQPFDLGDISPRSLI